MKRIALFIVCLLFNVRMAAAADRIAGLLALPEVFGGGSCATFVPEDIPLYASPNDARPIAEIRVDQNWSFAPHGGCEGLVVRVHQGERKQELPTLEYDYEMPAAIVLEHHDRWFRIRLHEQSAWLKASVVDEFMPLSDLFEEFVGVTTINKSFSGRLVGSPGAITGPILPRVAPNQPVRVIEIRESLGRSWVQLEVLSNSACTAGKDGPPEVIATGWLPMYDNDGEPTVWFSSRGC